MSPVAAHGPILRAEGEIPTGRASILPLEAGERLRIINHLGQQVLDTWAFVADDLNEYLSMEQCRGRLYKLFFEPGDLLLSSYGRPILRFVADTSPGRHDTLCAACDGASYEAQGLGRSHPNCTDNFRRAFAHAGVTVQTVPCPWNLFMEIPVPADGRLDDRPSSTRPGDYVELVALCDLFVVCSPCPQAEIPISGVGRPPRGLRWARFGPGAPAG
jgi:uncharacterized protein YcgI (DUF1989 family)